MSAGLRQLAEAATGAMATSDEAVRLVACRVCGAGPGNPCHVVGQRWAAAVTHSARVYAATHRSEAEFRAQVLALLDERDALAADLAEMTREARHASATPSARRCEGLAPFHCGNPTCPVHGDPATDDERELYIDVLERRHLGDEAELDAMHRRLADMERTHHNAFEHWKRAERERDALAARVAAAEALCDGQHPVAHCGRDDEVVADLLRRLRATLGAAGDEDRADDGCTFNTDGTCRMPEDACSNAGECLWDKIYQYEEPDE